MGEEGGFMGEEWEEGLAARTTRHHLIITVLQHPLRGHPMQHHPMDHHPTGHHPMDHRIDAQQKTFPGDFSHLIKDDGA